MQIPTIEPALLAAYRQLELSRRLSLEQVMSDRAYAIGVRNLADAMARRGTSGDTTGETRTVIDPTQDLNTLAAYLTQIQYSNNEKGGR